MLDSTATVILTNDDGCSRIEAGHSLDVCPLIGETVGVSCEYDAATPSNTQALAGAITVFDNNGGNTNLGVIAVNFMSTDDNGLYSCQATNPVCSNTVAKQDFIIAVHGQKDCLLVSVSVVCMVA